MEDTPHPYSRLFAPLSQRERDILALLAQGHSDRQIAASLVLAYTTVKWYNRQIFNKLGVTSRQQAVEHAFANGLIEVSEPVRAAKDHLPAHLTPFVGRVSELDDLMRLLTHPHTRFVTILAPGGMGKTRLALAAAQLVLEQFRDGVYFVPCAPLISSEQVLPTIAEVLAFEFFADSRAPKQQLLDFLRSQQMLLLLDNLEHLPQTAALIADILQAAPQVKVVSTSRERLKLEGETIYGLTGMSYPENDDGAHVLEYGAVQLFVECARRADARFVAQDLASIIRICQLVQGMPLAVELAAGWSGILTPSEIAGEIARSVDFLVTTQHDVPERLQSVRAVFEGTWQRLTDEERQVFRRLSVFRGGCTRDAAQVVTGAELTLLASLVDKSLLWHQTDSGRYEIHELLRQYAAEQLEAAGEMKPTQNAHRDYFGRLAQKWARALKTPQQLTALEVLEADYDNIRAAFARAIESGTSAIIEPFTDLWYFYEIRCRDFEGKAIFEAAIEALRGEESLVLGKVLAGRSHFMGRLNEWEHCRRDAEMSCDILRRMGAEHEILHPIMWLGAAVGALGDLEHQETIFREGLSAARQCDDLWAVSLLLYLVGKSDIAHQRLEEAKHQFSESSVLMAKLGNAWGLGFSFRDLGYIAYQTGDYDAASRWFAQGLANARKAGNRMNMMAGFGGLRLTALAKGNLLLAKQFGEEEVITARKTGNPHYVLDALFGSADVTIEAHDLPDARQYLSEALTLVTDSSDSFQVIVFCLLAVPFLTQSNAKTEAVTLVSFLDHHPKLTLFDPSDRQKLQTRTAQLRSELTSDVFMSAWDHGQNLTSDDVLARLHVLI
jgi:predicted ATPase/DNA-binding CsgD family transcriptional regulator